MSLSFFSLCSVAAWTGCSAGGHLVIHVGLHKTSTTSTQAFLTSHSKALDSDYGIKVAASETAKSGARIANTLAEKHGMYYSPKYLEDSVKKIRAWLSNNLTVLLSSESFDRMSYPVFEDFLSRVGADNSTAVVSLREPTSWLRSYWHLSMSHHNYQSFQAWLLEERPENLASPYTTVQNARRAFDRVDVVSFDYLRYLGNTVASYLVCNVSLGLSGHEDWRRCVERIDEKVPHSNPSSQPIFNDLVRYANTAKKVLGCSSSKLLDVNVESSEFKSFLHNVPTTCSTSRDHLFDEEFFSSSSNSYFSHMFQQSWNSWLNRDLHALSQNHSLGYTPKPICIVDDAKLTSSHWADIVRLYLPSSCHSVSL